MTHVLRVSRVRYPVEVLGPGRRLGVWVQGCPLSCHGCMARDTWDPTSGTEVAVADLVEVWRRRLADGACGLTVSGGEPLAQPESLGEFLSGVAALRDPARQPVADIMVYTGYERDDLSEVQLAALRHADVVVTGRYDAAKPTRLIWRGSSNQTFWLRTDLGRERFAAFVDAAPEQTPLQVTVEDDGRVWLIGVPRHRDLARLERWLRASGMTVEAASWRNWS
ncbi:4Fe-4S single cluster domain-containing protein [Catellatospora sp. KI3]|uniref:4Fe-4S single cluster domain-containing protein n=1 Tax=Catellatospora sp. KI3 TaxID=3041620 RepID=UPI002482B864|nr:4Fe-4S single cluster domain-containing protein [Catellatospora sp. KI3]MDI1462832.1 4Fe-4S single cluster domain-containing protein [Catellatospora sp. KI3]